MCAVGWDCPTRRVNYIYSTHFSFVKHRMTSGRGSYWLLVTRYSYFTLRQGFGWQAPPPVARSATPPARNPPTQTMFARGLGAVGIHTTDAMNYYNSFHSWAVELNHPGPTTHENCIFAGPGIVPPLHRGELRPRRYWGSTPIRRKG